MRTIGNILWLVLAGFWLALGYVAAGIIAFLPIITIPFAVQAFKLAGYALWPFGRVVIARQDGSAAVSLIANIIWFIVAGWWLTLAHLATGLALMLTIIGIPLGVANIKLAALALAPFGSRVVTLAEAERLGERQVASVRPLDER
jgi:uncharacterized membrane protein YccF (DUF307 family)